MPYNQSLDVQVFKDMKEFGDTRITIGVFSYNNGEKKLQITRENKTDEDWRFTKMGRLTKSEVQEILPLIQKAVQNM